MKPFRIFLLSIMILVSPKILAQRFFAAFECASGNIQSSFLGIPTQILNATIMSLADYDFDDENSGIPGYSFTYRIHSIRNAGQKVDYDGYKIVRFLKPRARDLFRDFEYSFKAGYQPVQIPVGFYVRVGYRHENFETRMNEGGEWVKHRSNCLRPGLGIRISPIENLLDDFDCCPIIDLGSTYDYYVSYRGEYGDDIKQINNGLSTQIGVGVKFKSGGSIILSLDREHYDFFNKDFEADGVKPYKDVTTKHFNIALSVALGI